MAITSAGMYRFLTNAYQQTANSLELLNSEVKFLEGKKVMYVDIINKTQKQIDSKTNRIDQLSTIRIQQEVRLDSLYSRRNYSIAKRTEAIMVDADNQIKLINSESDSLLKVIQAQQDSIGSINTEILFKNSNSNITADIGPLKYLGELTGAPLKNIINWFTILLVLVFDPLAIVLIIAFNRIMNKEEVQKELPIETPTIEYIAKQPVIQNEPAPQIQEQTPIIESTTPPQPKLHTQNNGPYRIG